MLKIKNLHASINNKKILNGINLTLKPGEIHVLMGPNGSGKSSLAKILAGHQDFDVSLGTITLDGKNLLEAAPDIRSEMGLFLAFQYPLEVPGVNLRNFLIIQNNRNLKNYRYLHLKTSCVKKPSCLSLMKHCLSAI